MKITDYTTVVNRSPACLADEVRELLTKGWQPQGGPVYDCDDQVFLQAMVKYESR